MWDSYKIPKKNSTSLFPPRNSMTQPQRKRKISVNSRLLNLQMENLETCFFGNSPGPVLSVLSTGNRFSSGIVQRFNESGIETVRMHALPPSSSAARNSCSSVSSEDEQASGSRSFDGKSSYLALPNLSSDNENLNATDVLENDGLESSVLVIELSGDSWSSSSEEGKVSDENENIIVDNEHSQGPVLPDLSSESGSNNSSYDGNDTGDAIVDAHSKTVTRKEDEDDSDVLTLGLSPNENVEFLFP